MLLDGQDSIDLYGGDKVMARHNYTHGGAVGHKFAHVCMRRVPDVTLEVDRAVTVQLPLTQAMKRLS